jgi:hypothetical protein
MKRDLAITPAVIAEVRARRIPVLISGKVVISWKTVKRR